MNRTHGSRAKIAAITTTAALLIGGAVAASPAFAADAPVTIVTTATTDWTYLDNNTDPAGDNADVNVWTKSDFNDSAWTTAKGSFGAKKGGKTGIGPRTANTLLKQYINGTSAPDTKTFFFRTDVTLTADQLDGIDGLTGNLIHDDAVRVFVNGTKVLGVDDEGVTQNLQYAGVSAGSPKTSAVTINKNVLREGENTIAVALYQDRDTSSDIYFDFTSLVTKPTADSTPGEPTVASVTDLVLNVGSDETKRNVAWYSNSGATEVVQVAKTSELSDGAFPTDAASFTATNGPATEAGSRYNHATITGLVENTSYSYRAGSSAGWTATKQFSTQKFDGDYSFLLVGDPQIGASGSVANDQAGWESTMNSAEAAFPKTEFIYSAGDQVETAPNETQYDAFLAPTQLTKYPLSTINGNHDVGSLAYEQHFNMPNLDKNYGAASNGTSSGGDSWFTYNDVLYITLNSNNRDTETHKAFLEKVVAEQGAAAKWTIVGFHHSIYSVASHANDSDIIARRSTLPTVLSDLGIDLVLMGHDHVYTRSFLMNKGAVAEDVAAGAQSTVTPDEGDVLYVTANSASGSKYYNIRNQTYDFAAVTNQEKIRNFSNVEVTDTDITVTTYRSDLMTEVDKVTLKKAKPADTTKPVFTVPADNEVTFGSAFDATAGVTALDDVDGDLTAGITVTGVVDTAALGTHELVYTVTDAAGNTATHTRTVTVVTGAFSATPAPAISGSATVGNTLFVATGAWTPAASFAFQWTSNGEAINGETGTSLLVTPALVGTKIALTVEGTRAGLATKTVESKTTTDVGKGALASTKPKIGGHAKVGRTVTAVVGAWTPGTTFSYRWYANGKAISGSNKQTITVTKSLVGKSLTVRVTGSAEGYVSKSVISAKFATIKK
ncbi:MAG: immunoglobulin-like domain-containing protein [Microbacteriaceae bacterium]